MLEKRPGPLFSEEIMAQLGHAFLGLPQGDAVSDPLSIAKDEIEAVLMEIDRGGRMPGGNLVSKVRRLVEEFATSMGLSVALEFSGFERLIDARVYQALFVNLSRLVEARWQFANLFQGPQNRAEFSIRLREQSGYCVVRVVETQARIDSSLVGDVAAEISVAVAKKGGVLKDLHPEGQGWGVEFAFPVDHYQEEVVICRVGNRLLTVPLQQWKATSYPGDGRSVESGSVISDRGVYPVINLGKLDPRLDTLGGRTYLLLHLDDIPCSVAVDEVVASDTLFFLSSRHRPSLVCGHANCSKYGLVFNLNTLLIAADFEAFSWRMPVDYRDETFQVAQDHPFGQLLSSQEFLLPVIHEAKQALEPRGVALEHIFTKIAEQVEAIKAKIVTSGRASVPLAELRESGLRPEDDYVRRLLLQQISRQMCRAA